MKLSGKERDRMRHLLQHTIRIRNHEIEHPDHYGAEHEASLARYRAQWGLLDPEQRAEAMALLNAAIGAAVAQTYVTRFGARDGLTDTSTPQAIAAAVGAHPDDVAVAVDYSGVADLTADAIAAAIAYLESTED